MKLKQTTKKFRRNIREPVIKLLFILFSHLPLRISHLLGKIIGQILWWGNGETRRISEINVNRCLPELSAAKRSRIIKKSLLETGKTMLEITQIWTWSKSELLNKIKKISGEEYVRDAMSDGRGAILLTPHLGAWEVAGLYLSINYPMTTMYRPPEMKGLEHIIKKGRTRFGVNLVSTDAAGVRSLFKTLKSGEMIGVLPDQDPGHASGEFAPFFGIETNTMTMISKLAQKTHSVVIVCSAKRLAKGEGYHLEFHAPVEQVDNKDLSISLAALNKEIETFIRKAPEQYQWSYKRFKRRPAGEPRFY